MRRFLGVLIVVAAALLATPPASAASPKLDLPDPAGDSLGAQASLDIVSVSLESKKLKARDPGPSLVITMKLAAPPMAVGARYVLSGEIPECGHFDATYAPGTLYSKIVGTEGAIFLGCGDPGGVAGGSLLILGHVSVKGPVITWTIAVDSLPKDVRAGGSIGEIQGYASLVEPVFGLQGPHDVGVTNDDVRTDKEFTFV
jgi:hypothetical protein